MEKDTMMEALFAAHALPAIIAQRGIHDANGAASAAYAMADAMMAEARKRDEIREKLRARRMY
jgi:hypothetical protein